MVSSPNVHRELFLLCLAYKPSIKGRLEISVEKPKVNAVICSHCMTYIESEHVHDFKECNCPELYGKDAHETIVMVDGGKEYVKRGVSAQSAWVEVEEWEWHGGRP